MSALQTLPLTLVHLTIASLSSYGLYQAYFSVNNVLRYEEQTEKAAKYSFTAEEQLHKTRTTQTTAVVTQLLSLLSSTYLLFASTSDKSTALAVPLLNGAVAFGARWYIMNFWKGKVKVPFVRKYNDAIKQTGQITWVLGALSGGWAGAGLLGLAV